MTTPLILPPALRKKINQVEPEAVELGMTSVQYRDYLSWRILIQVIALQFSTLKKLTISEEIMIWERKIQSTAERARKLTAKFPPQQLPLRIPNPVQSDYLAPNAPQVYWLEVMIQQLTLRQLPVTFVNISRIDSPPPQEGLKT